MIQWQLDLKNAVTSYKSLFSILNIDPASISHLPLTDSGQHPLLVTHSFINRMTLGNPQDPLLLQVLPGAPNTTNNNSDPQYTSDPLQEQQFNPMPGLIHKYYGRVLLLAAKSCAIHCSYCFRQHFPYYGNIASGKNLQAIIKYLGANPSISEVILSGGDPLLATNNYFKQLLNQLDNIEHITTLRIHSRIPIVLPTRLEESLLELLAKSRLKIILVVHTNHPNEINQEVAAYCKLLPNYNITLLNQSVLLKNVNDCPNVLAALSRKLFMDLNAIPYYLHILDPVIGADHFAIPIQRAKNIFADLGTMVPGYLLPKLAQEIPGKQAKTLVI